MANFMMAAFSSRVMSNKSPPPTIFIFDQPHRCQEFSLPKTIVQYCIKKIIKHEDCYKFSKTCTYFALKLKKPFLDEACEIWNGYEKSLSSVVAQHFTNIPESLYITRNPYFSKILDIFCFFSFENLHITNIFLTWNEFNLLVSNPKTKELSLSNLFILESNNSVGTMDAIFPRIKNITHLYYFNVEEIFTNSTFEKMISTPKPSKLQRLRIDFSGFPEHQEKIDPKQFIKFMIIHSEENSNFTFWFPNNISRGYLRNIKKMMEKSKFLLETINLEICPFI